MLRRTRAPPAGSPETTRRSLRTLRVLARARRTARRRRSGPHHRARARDASPAERKRRRDRFSRGAVGIGRRRAGANGRRPGQSAAAQDRTRSCQSDIPADGARGGIPARSRPMSERLRIPQSAAAGADPHALAARGARPGGDAAEGPLQALASDRDRADGSAADRGDVRLHAASLGSGDPQALRGGGARRRSADRPLSKAAARGGRRLFGESRVRKVPHGRVLAAGRSFAAGHASLLLRRIGSADADPSERDQEAGHASRSGSTPSADRA